jgi:hypothetical protein
LRTSARRRCSSAVRPPCTSCGRCLSASGLPWCSLPTRRTGKVGAEHGLVVRVLQRMLFLDHDVMHNPSSFGPTQTRVQHVLTPCVARRHAQFKNFYRRFKSLTTGRNVGFVDVRGYMCTLRCISALLGVELCHTYHCCIIFITFVVVPFKLTACTRRTTTSGLSLTTRTTCSTPLPILTPMTTLITMITMLTTRTWMS